MKKFVSVILSLFLIFNTMPWPAGAVAVDFVQGNEFVAPTDTGSDSTVTETVSDSPSSTKAEGPVGTETNEPNVTATVSETQSGASNQNGNESIPDSSDSNQNSENESTYTETPEDPITDDLQKTEEQITSDSSEETPNPSALILNSLVAGSNQVSLGSTITWSFNCSNADSINFSVLGADGSIKASGSLTSERTISYTPDTIGTCVLKLTATNATDECTLTSSVHVVRDGEQLDASLETTQRYAVVNEKSIRYSLRLKNGTAPYVITVHVVQKGETCYENTYTAASADDVDIEYMPEAYGKCETTVAVADASGKTASFTAEMPVAVNQTESQEERRASVENAKVTENWRTSLVEVAKTQVGYKQNNRNFIIDSDNKIHYYTRYGADFGVPYSDPWDAVFVVFCLDYAKIPAEYIAHDDNSERWAEWFREAECFKEFGEGRPSVGDLVFMDISEAERINHVGIVVKVSGAEMKVIEALNGAVSANKYSLSDERICGYASMSLLMKKSGLFEHKGIIEENLCDCYDDNGQRLCDEACDCECHIEDDTDAEVIDDSEAENPEVAEPKVFCGLVEHAHNLDCYDDLANMICELPEHMHNEACFTEAQVEHEPDAPVYDCGMEEHIHTEACYDEQGNLVCELPEHTYAEDNLTEAQGESEPVASACDCGMEEHTHTEACYDVQGNLVCELLEHTHTEACMIMPVIPVYYCGTEEHTHTEACYDEQGNLVCELPEHTHTEACMIMPVVPVYYCGMEEHIHTGACYDEQGNLVCEIPEHTHTEACMIMPVIPVYYCGTEEHTHTEACYDEQGNLVCEIPEHTHTEDCLQVPMIEAFLGQIIGEQVSLMAEPRSDAEVLTVLEQASVLSVQYAVGNEFGEVWLSVLYMVWQALFRMLR